MKILIHAGKGNEKTAALEKQIIERLQGIQIRRSHKITALAGELKQPLNNISVIIIFVQMSAALNALFSLEPLFDNKKLILVLPAMGTQAIARGLELNPTFISSTDKGEDEILMVLGQINRRHKTKDNCV